MTNGVYGATILSLEQRELWLKGLRFSQNLEEIDNAIYSEKPDVLDYVVWNPLLTEEHIRYLYPKIKYPLYRVFLIQNPLFPSDLLLEIAMTVDPSYEGDYIKVHPNATEEIKILLALRNSEGRR